MANNIIVIAVNSVLLYFFVQPVYSINILFDHKNHFKAELKAMAPNQQVDNRSNCPGIVGQFGQLTVAKRWAATCPYTSHTAPLVPLKTWRSPPLPPHMWCAQHTRMASRIIDSSFSYEPTKPKARRTVLLAKPRTPSCSALLAFTVCLRCCRGGA